MTRDDIVEKIWEILRKRLCSPESKIIKIQICSKVYWRMSGDLWVQMTPTGDMNYLGGVEKIESLKEWIIEELGYCNNQELLRKAFYLI